ncbi:MAG: hypothetical protein IJ802_04715 [Kiritimatiellae bacterium]|nr:hypothetical protein [Kiritimatiellia bacterium]
MVKRIALLAAFVSSGAFALTLPDESDCGDSIIKTVKEAFEDVEAKAAQYVAEQNADGSWGDVDYKTAIRSAWPAEAHLSRMKTIARAARSPERTAAFKRALEFWLAGGFENPNWWWNQIGAPLDLGAAAAAMKDELSAEEIARTVDAMRICKIGMTGMNKVWLAECVLYRAILEGNREDMEAARDAIRGEVAVSRSSEGIQRDWSFHQHGNQPQFGNYGASYVLSVPRLANMLEELGLGIGAEKREILANLVKRGFMPTVWKGYMDVGALGRQLTPGAAAFKGAAVALAARSVGLEDYDVPEGLHFFPNSAYAVYRAKNWMAAVKCGTASIKGCEMVNDDNRLGAHLEDGALFCYVDGREYEDIFPLWNWRRIPGITSYDIDTIDWKVRNKANVFKAEGDAVRFELDRAGLKAAS